MEREFVERAIELGADDAVIFKISDIEFDPRTILICMFGCGDWGKGHTCPSRPNSPSVFQYKEIFEKYKWGIIVHSTDKKISQEVSFELEREAFTKGYYLAFSLSDCSICGKCRGFENKECANPRKARPAFHSVGIDVFKTVRKFGLPIETLKETGEQQNWYSAVFIE